MDTHYTVPLHNVLSKLIPIIMQCSSFITITFLSTMSTFTNISISRRIRPPPFLFWGILTRGVRLVLKVCTLSCHTQMRGGERRMPPSLFRLKTPVLSATNPVPVNECIPAIALGPATYAVYTLHYIHTVLLVRTCSSTWNDAFIYLLKERATQETSFIWHHHINSIEWIESTGCQKGLEIQIMEN